MPMLYVSTDHVELEELVNPDERSTVRCRDIAERMLGCYRQILSFTPGSMANVDEKHTKDIYQMAGELAEMGLFAAVGEGGKISEYKPRDLEYRNKILSLALQMNFRWMHGSGNSEGAWNLILYSNNANSPKEPK